MYCKILIFIFIIFKLWCVEKMKINIEQNCYEFVWYGFMEKYFMEFKFI